MIFFFSEIDEYRKIQSNRTRHTVIMNVTLIMKTNGVN